jgi:phosphoglycolate phosphatase
MSPLLVFDLDGTLAETAGDLVATLNVILSREGLPPVSLADGRNMVGAGARALIQSGFARASQSIEGDRLEKLFRDFIDYYEAHIADHSHLFEGVVPALDRFASAGWRFAVCTNKVEKPAVHLLQKLGVADRFAFICGQDTIFVDGKAVAKPDPRVLLATIEKAGGSRETTIMVGDSVTDIRTAQAAKIPVVAVDFGYTEQHVSTFGPDLVISHFDALWDAVGQLRGQD